MHVDGQRQHPFVEQLAELAEHPRAGDRVVEQRIDPDHRAAATIQRQGRQLHVAIDRCGDDRDAAEGGQRRYRRWQPEAGGIEDHIGAALEYVVDLHRQVFRCIQGDGGDALRLQFLRLAGTPHARQHLRTERLGQGDGRRTDGAGADHQQAGIGVHLGALQGIPGGGVGHAATGGLGEAQRLRHQRHAVGR
ncbi:hypothetical protein D3C81_1258950 [compost metagenome]